MLKKASSFMLVGFIIQAAIFSVPASVNAQTDAEVERAVRARTAIHALGTEARVSVKLRDKRRLAGEISRINEDNFALTNAKTGLDVTVAYADVLEIKRKNRDGLSTGMTVLIVMSIVGFIGGFLNN